MEALFVEVDGDGAVEAGGGGGDEVEEGPWGFVAFEVEVFGS